MIKMILLLISLVLAADTTLTCKCTCTLNQTQTQVSSCLLCTKLFCQTNCNDNTTVIASCFQRGSYKDEGFIISFLVIVSCLLLFIILEPVFDKYKYKFFGARTYSVIN